MRHWLLILMIALLPLRGWMGGAMAVEMVAQPAHTSMAVGGHGAGHAEAAAHAGHEGHAGHAGQVYQHAMPGEHCVCGEQAAAANADHQHNACDVCNVPALAAAGVHLQTPPPAHGQLAQPAEQFASSEAQRGVKPPIS